MWSTLEQYMDRTAQMTAHQEDLRTGLSRTRQCQDNVSHLYDEVDELQLPHLLHLKISDQETDVVTLQ